MRARFPMLRSLVVTVTLCAGLAAPSLPATASTASAASTATAVSPAAGFVADINAARAAHGLHPVKVSTDLTQVAAKWAVTMAGHRSLSHNPKLGSAIRDWRGLAENVGMGQSVPQIHAAFMASAPHRANILNAIYSQVGVGVVVIDGQVYVVEDFRQPA